MQQQVPEGLEPYKRTRTFDAETVPQALLRDHETADAVWGKLVVESGSVRVWFADDPDHAVLARRREPVALAPHRKHRVTPSEDARFYVEFYRSEGPAPDYDDD